MCFTLQLCICIYLYLYIFIRVHECFREGMRLKKEKDIIYMERDRNVHTTQRCVWPHPQSPWRFIAYVWSPRLSTNHRPPTHFLPLVLTYSSSLFFSSIIQHKRYIRLLPIPIVVFRVVTPGVNKPQQHYIPWQIRFIRWLNIFE